MIVPPGMQRRRTRCAACDGRAAHWPSCRMQLDADAAEGQAALKRMRFGSFNASLASQAFAEAGGGIFRPGATSSTGPVSYTHLTLPTNREV